MSHTIEHDAGNRRFHTTVDGREAHLTYERLDASTVDFQHTFTPPELRGRGIAGEIVRHALDWARAEGLAVVPSCPYVARWIEGHSAYQDLLARRG